MVFLRLRKGSVLKPRILLLAAIALIAAAVPASAGERQAPLFSIRDLDGKVFKLADAKGHPVLIDFWATWCRPCRASMPHLSQLQDQYAKDGLIILGLSLDDIEPRAVRRYARSIGVKFRLAMADEDVLHLYGPIRSIPTTFFIDRDGRVARRVIGYIDPETMETYTLELFGGSEEK
jgi:thiol-disulfide isomerase/thioredoxin